MAQNKNRKKTSTRKSASKSASKSAAKTSKSTGKGMKVTSRIVDVRRHTIGYIAGGKKYTVSEIRKLAQNGRVRGVHVVGNHIQALPGQKRLTDLPIKLNF